MPRTIIKELEGAKVRIAGRLSSFVDRFVDTLRVSNLQNPHRGKVGDILKITLPDGETHHLWARFDTKQGPQVVLNDHDVKLATQLQSWKKGAGDKLQKAISNAETKLSAVQQTLTKMKEQQQNYKTKTAGFPKPQLKNAGKVHHTEMTRLKTLLLKQMATLQDSVPEVCSEVTKACFAAVTPLLTPYGSKPIEKFVAGDEILSRDEYNPDGPVLVKIVEEVFERTGPVLNLHIAGQLIRTSGEHPFYVVGKGWTPANELQPGDLLVSHDGQLLPVEEVYDTGEWETLYNLRVSDFHTYFVGCINWKFSLWAHNRECVDGETMSKLLARDTVHPGQLQFVDGRNAEGRELVDKFRRSNVYAGHLRERYVDENRRAPICENARDTA